MKIPRTLIVLVAMIGMGTLSNTARAVELVDGTWDVSVYNNNASGANWKITGTPIGGMFTAFSGERRAVDSSYFIGGFGIGSLLIGTNSSVTPSGNRSGIVFAIIDAQGQSFAGGRWIDSSGNYPFSGYRQP